MKNSKLKNILFSLLATLLISMVVTENSFAQITTIDGSIYFQDQNQSIKGNGSHTIDFRSNHNTTARINFHNNANTRLGGVYGYTNPDNGSRYFGFTDADGNWSYATKTDSWTIFKINDETKMMLRANGNVGIGTDTPSQKLHIVGNIHAEGWIKSMSRYFYFGDVQRLSGDDASALYYKSNHSNYTQLIFRDKENEAYGRVLGSGNGTHFGLADGDGDWSYKAAKDDYTAFLINDDEKMRIKSNGRVGIGFTAPQTKLEVKGTVRATSTGTRNNRTEIGHNGNSYVNAVGTGNLYFRHDGNNKMGIKSDGKVFIGDVASATNDYKLFVEKGILTEKVRVAVKSTSDWSDYVFEKDYEVMPIDELEDYVTKNKHLPNVPSAEEVVKDGIDMATMDAKLLEKIEEAYLYIIQLENRIKTLENNSK